VRTSGTGLLERKAKLARLMAKVKDGLQFNNHMEGEGSVVFRARLQART